MSTGIATREPIEFVAGDTLTFTRHLSDYLPANGWSLTYEIRGLASAIEFTSTVSTDTTGHVLLVSADKTAIWGFGDAVLVGYAINATQLDANGQSQRERIYYGALSIHQNLQGSEGDVDVQTFAQKMLVALETQLLALANLALEESRSVDWMVKYTPLREVERSHGYWSNVRRNEIARERAKAGLPTGQESLPLARICASGPIVGQQLWAAGAYR